MIQSTGTEFTITGLFYSSVWSVSKSIPTYTRSTRLIRRSLFLPVRPEIPTFIWLSDEDTRRGDCGWTTQLTVTQNRSFHGYSRVVLIAGFRAVKTSPACARPGTCQLYPVGIRVCVSPGQNLLIELWTGGGVALDVHGKYPQSRLMICPKSEVSRFALIRLYRFWVSWLPWMSQIFSANTQNTSSLSSPFPNLGALSWIHYICKFLRVRARF